MAIPPANFPFGCGYSPPLASEAIASVAADVAVRIAAGDVSGTSSLLDRLGLTRELQAPAVLQMAVGYGISHAFPVDRADLERFLLRLRETAEDDAPYDSRPPFLRDAAHEKQRDEFVLAGLEAYLALKAPEGEGYAGALAIVRDEIEEREDDNDLSRTGPLYARTWNATRAGAFDRVYLLASLAFCGFAWKRHAPHEAGIRCLFGEAFKSVELLIDDYSKSLALENIAHALGAVGREEESAAAYDRAVDAARRVAFDGRRAHALGVLAYSLQDERGLSLGEEALEASRGIEGPVERARVLSAVLEGHGEQEVFESAPWRDLTARLLQEGLDAAARAPAAVKEDVTRALRRSSAAAALKRSRGR